MFAYTFLKERNPHEKQNSRAFRDSIWVIFEFIFYLKLFFKPNTRGVNLDWFYRRFFLFYSFILLLRIFLLILNLRIPRLIQPYSPLGFPKSLEAYLPGLFPLRRTDREKQTACIQTSGTRPICTGPR